MATSSPKPLILRYFIKLAAELRNARDCVVVLAVPSEPVSTSAGLGIPPEPTEVIPQLIRQLIAALWLPSSRSHEDNELSVLSALNRMQDIKPSGPIESMLAVQMVAGYEAAMECLRRAGG